jgi:nitrous oxidase accessory protein NosD
VTARRTTVLAALAVAAVAVAGCSGNDDPSAAPSPSPSSDASVGGGGGVTGPSASPTKKDKGDDPSGSPVADAPAAPPPDPGPVKCPGATVTVSSADDLTRALSEAKPGDSIALADGTYTGKFVTTKSGTRSAPIFLCGGSGAVLDGGGVRAGYGLYLNGASWWRLVGFTVRNAQKGVVADKSQHSVIQGLTVQDIGDEGIHLRSFSSDNLVVGNTVHDTGKRREKFGEGIYVGSATSNWAKYSQGGPDRSDRNVVRGNSISGTTAESVDIKEGTTAGVLVGNVFDGSALTEEGGDSWVDVKGNSWLIQDNRGTNSSLDGFQTHNVADGWGTGNVFKGNTAIAVKEYGIALKPVLGNKVACDNKASGGKGLANVSCA